MKVIKIPRRRVVPTVLIGRIGTNSVHVRTLNPMIVVNAENIRILAIIILAFTWLFIFNLPDEE